MHEEIQIRQNICPHNCYSTCGIRTFVNGGKIVDIDGDSDHPYTKGKLCSKGYTLSERVYHPDRVLYPMMQEIRKSGQWRRISWEQASTIIAEKMVSLIERDQTKSIFFDIQSGSIGVLQQALRKMFTAFGPISMFGNDLCAANGTDAHYITFGGVCSPEPEEMVNARSIIIWGGNPAATCVHQMAVLKQVRQRGGRIVVIDPLQTASAVYADIHIPIRPGTDGALALGVMRYICEHGMWDQQFVAEHVHGWDEFLEYVLTEVTLEWSAETTGVSVQQIQQLAELLCIEKPAAIWQGMGGQRHINGGQNYRIINALLVASGNINMRGGGVYYIDLKNLENIAEPFTQSASPYEHRYFDIHSFTESLDPEIKMSFICGSNPIAQYPNSSSIRSFFDNIEFNVTVEHFFTATTAYTDIILPAATFFEKPDILGSYWHPFIAYNQRAIAPLQESKDEYEIARLIAKELSHLGHSQALEILKQDNAEQFLKAHYCEFAKNLDAHIDYQQFIQGGYYRKIRNQRNCDSGYDTPSGKIELASEIAQAAQLPRLPEYILERSPKRNYPFRFLTVHSETMLNSQFSNIEVLQKITEGANVYINAQTARSLHLDAGDKVRIYNQQGEIVVHVDIRNTVPDGIIMCYQGEQNTELINTVIEPLTTDMGTHFCGFNSIAYHDTFVNINKV